MIFGASKTFAWILCVSLITCALAHGSCAINVVIVKGRVEHIARDAKVRVQLVYPKKQLGDSGEVTVENGTFSIPIEFLTQSRRPVLMGELREKCDRKPKTVVITLVAGDQEYDRISLDFANDFKMADPSAYVLRSEVVLNGPL